MQKKRYSDITEEMANIKTLLAVTVFLQWVTLISVYGLILYTFINK